MAQNALLEPTSDDSECEEDDLLLKLPTIRVRKKFAEGKDNFFTN